MDSYIEETLIPQHTRGKNRAMNPEYQRFSKQIRKARQSGDIDTAQHLTLARRQLPAGVTHDPDFRRLTYLRYADDFLLGFIGPKSEAEAIKADIGKYLHDELHLDMSPTKTLITHARTEYAKFLGYAISVQHNNAKLALIGDTSRTLCSVNGTIRLGLPFGLIDEKAKRYKRNGKVI